MKIELCGPGGLDAVVEVAPDVLAECPVILYNGQHYLFEGFSGRFQTNVRFGVIKPPLEIAIQKQPEPPRRFMDMKKGEIE